jgi:hypothetical protein
MLSDVRIRMCWDGDAPAVDVPLGDFFGSGKYEINMMSLPIGMKTAGYWYCYFPMPFWESAEIRLINEGTNDLESLLYEIQYATNAYERSSAGYFHAHFAEESFQDNGRDFNFITENGRGHLVGISLFMESAGAGGYQDMNYLEGDERAFVDGAASPCIHGTGNEDYFNCGWYFNYGTFSRPSHGHPWRDQFNGGETNFTQAYRFHLGDSMPFNQSIAFGVEHGHWAHPNTAPGTYSSVTYYYKASDFCGAELLADLNPGDEWSEALYDYRVPDTAVFLSNSLSYAGDNLGREVADSGYSWVGSSGSSFRIPLSANCTGLLIRRRLDMGAGVQRARVFIDDRYAGTWYDVDHNYQNGAGRWVDAEFMVPSDIIAGKAAVRISIEPLLPSGPWNEFRYWIYGIKPAGSNMDIDGDGIPDSWEQQYVPSLEILSAELDYDSDGFSDSAEYVGGTSPVTDESFPEIMWVQNTIRMNTVLGCLYTIEQTACLASNEWHIFRKELPGIGSRLEVPVDFSSASSCFRLQIQRP